MTCFLVSDQVKGKRSIGCNGRVVRELREQQGLRQVDLARLAGYSVRLIGKAEAGKPLSIETIETLAEALSMAGELVTPGQLVLNLTRLGEGYLQLRYGRSRKEVGRFLAPNFVLRVSCDIPALDFQPEYHGQVGLETYCGLFGRLLESHRDDESVIPNARIFEASNEVIAWCDNVWYSRLQAIAVLIVTRLTFTDGKLVEQEDRFTKVLVPQKKWL